MLRQHGFTGVEIVPTMWHRDGLLAPAPEMRRFGEYWSGEGLSVVAVQSLLHGHPKLQLFDAAARPALQIHLARCIDAGREFGARVLVFGAPRNRRRGSLALSDATRVAADFFRGVGEMATAAGVVITIEPSPPEYGCDFITTTAEAIAFVALVGSAGVAVQGDTGAIWLSGELAPDLLARHSGDLEHFHVSEPDLKEIGTCGNDHATMAAALRACAYERWVSVEMREEGLAALDRALRFVATTYGNSQSVATQ